MPDAVNALELVNAIIAKEDEYNALAERLKTWKPEQANATPAPVPVKTLADLISERGNLRSNVSKAKAKLAHDPENALKQEHLRKLQLALEAVELSIKFKRDQERSDETQTHN